MDALRRIPSHGAVAHVKDRKRVRQQQEPLSPEGTLSPARRRRKKRHGGQKPVSPETMQRTAADGDLGLQTSFSVAESLFHGGAVSMHTSSVCCGGHASGRARHAADMKASPELEAPVGSASVDNSLRAEGTGCIHTSSACCGGHSAGLAGHAADVEASAGLEAQCGGFGVVGVVGSASFLGDNMRAISRSFNEGMLTAQEREMAVRRLQGIIADFKASRMKKPCKRGLSPKKGAVRLTPSSGCKHYKRNCRIKAKCCDKYYDCRICHDEAEDHQMDRFATELVACKACGAQDMPVGPNCLECGAEYARYFCPKCKLYDDDHTKDIYHCDECGICRLGKKEEQYHCSKCGSCVPKNVKDTHPCLANSLKSNCPVCQEYMGDSTKQVIYMRCGHAMHADCFAEYTKTQYVCPLCSKSLTDMKRWYEALDERLRRELPLPGPWGRRRSNIYCNDCEKKSRVQFHFQYHRCSHCAGYNTRLLSYEDGDDCDDDRDTDGNDKPPEHGSPQEVSPVAADQNPGNPKMECPDVPREVPREVAQPSDSDDVESGTSDPVRILREPQTI